MADGTTEETTTFSRSMELRAVREQDREVDFVCSTESVDSYGTKLMQSGWDFSRFDKNPVVLWAHCSRELPVGQAVKYGVVNNELVATVRIATAEANPKAENVWQSILQKTLRGISVRFDPLEYHFEKANPQAEEILVFDRQVLEELSVCPLPSNIDTLAKLRERAMAQSRPATPSPKTLTGRATPSTGENSMSDLAQEVPALKSKVVDLETKNRDLDFELRATKKLAEDEGKRATEATERAEAFAAQNKRLVDERDTATKRAEELDAKLIERDVDALIGKKLTADERDWAVSLCRKDRALFDQMITQRKDMELTKQVIPSTGNDTPPPAATGRAAAEDAEKSDWESVSGAIKKR